MVRDYMNVGFGIEFVDVTVFVVVTYVFNVISVIVVVIIDV